MYEVYDNNWFILVYIGEYMLYVYHVIQHNTIL